MHIAVIYRNRIPPEIMEEEDINAFVSELSKGNSERTTMKLVVLGNGQIGKSTLVNFLKHENKYHNKSQIKVCLKSGFKALIISRNTLAK